MAHTWHSVIESSAIFKLVPISVIGMFQIPLNNVEIISGYFYQYEGINKPKTHFHVKSFLISLRNWAHCLFKMNPFEYYHHWCQAEYGEKLSKGDDPEMNTEEK